MDMLPYTTLDKKRVWKNFLDSYPVVLTQIVPRILMEAYDSASPEQIKAVNAAVMTMKRLDIASIQALLD